MANPVTPLSTQALPKAIDPAVRKQFVDTYEQVKPKYEKVFKVSDQVDYNEQHQLYPGLGTLPVVAQGATYTTDSLIQAYGTTYTPVKYGELIQVTDEMMRYDKTGVVAKAKGISDMQAKAAARQIDTNASNVYLRGFNTSYTSYGDSKPLFSTIHTRADGGTAISNASATGITLTEANLETSMLAANIILDDRGQLVNIYCDTLLIPPALQKTASIITKSQLRSGTADNDVNVYSMQEMDGLLNVNNVYVWKYLASGVNTNGSNTAWYLIDSNNMMVNWLWGVRPEVGKMDQSVGYLTDTYVWKVRFEHSTGWDNWRGVWASKGDGAAYAS